MVISIKHPGNGVKRTDNWPHQLQSKRLTSITNICEPKSQTIYKFKQKIAVMFYKIL